MGRKIVLILLLLLSSMAVSQFMMLVSAEPVQDVAVVDVKTFSPIHGQLGTWYGGPGGGPPLTPVTEGFSTWIIKFNVTVQNQGNETETFTVQAYYGNATGNYTTGITPSSTNVTLAPGDNTTVIFTWDIPDPYPTYPTYPVPPPYPRAYWPYPVFTIYGEAVLAGDINPENNIKAAPQTVTLKWVGDANGDGHVDIRDLIALTNTWYKPKTHPMYNPQCDWNKPADGNTDILDLIILVDWWYRGPGEWPWPPITPNKT